MTLLRTVLLWLVLIGAALPSSAQVLVVIDSIAPGMNKDSNWSEKNLRGFMQGGKDFTLHIDIYKGKRLALVQDPKFALSNYQSAIIMIDKKADYTELLSRLNRLQIPIILFVDGTLKFNRELSALLEISSSNYALGVKTGERASLLGTLTSTCLYSEQTEVNMAICKGFHFGHQGRLIGEKSVFLPSNNRQAATQSVLNELELERAKLYVTLDSYSAQIVHQVLTKQNKIEGDYFHITMARDPEILKWIEQDWITFAFYHQPWLEGYLATAAASVAAKRLWYDPLDIVVFIRTNPLIQQRIDDYSFIVDYKDLRLHTSTGFVDSQNIDTIRPLWGSIW